MKEPLNQFAERIIRLDEVKYFIKGLLDKGVDPAVVLDAVADNGLSVEG